MATLILKSAYVEIKESDEEAQVRVKPREGPTSGANPVFVMTQPYRRLGWWKRRRIRRQLRRFDR